METPIRDAPSPRLPTLNLDDMVDACHQHLRDPVAIVMDQRSWMWFSEVEAPFTARRLLGHPVVIDRAVPRNQMVVVFDGEALARYLSSRVDHKERLGVLGREHSVREVGCVVTVGSDTVGSDTVGLDEGPVSDVGCE